MQMTSNFHQPLDSPDAIRQAYEGRSAAADYVAIRFTSELTRFQHVRQVNAINRAFAQKRPSAALEIACGPGRLTRDVRPVGKLTCLEYNSGMLEEARRSCPPGIDWIQGDAFAMTFDHCFDLAYSFRFIRHFRRPDRERLYKEIHRALRPGGLLVMDAVNRVVSGPLRSANPDEYPIYDKLYDSVDELRVELKDSGFELLKAEPILRWHSAQYRSQVLLGPRSRLLCRGFIHCLEYLRRGPALEWVVTCRRE